MWCYDYFNDAVKCIFRPLDIYKRLDDFNPEKNKKLKGYFNKKSWIGELMYTNKLKVKFVV